MTVPLPPPRILWPKMLKACSKADLELLRCEVLIQMAKDGFTAAEDANKDRVEFLRRIKLEAKRRKRISSSSRLASAEPQSLGAS